MEKHLGTRYELRAEGRDSRTFIDPQCAGAAFFDASREELPQLVQHDVSAIEGSERQARHTVIGVTEHDRAGAPMHKLLGMPTDVRQGYEAAAQRSPAQAIAVTQEQRQSQDLHADLASAPREPVTLALHEHFELHREGHAPQQFGNARQAGAAFYAAPIEQQPRLLHLQPDQAPREVGSTASTVGMFTDLGVYQHPNKVLANDLLVDVDVRAGYFSAMEQSVINGLHVTDWKAATDSSRWVVPRLDQRLYGDLQELTMNHRELALQAWLDHAPEDAQRPTFIDLSTGQVATLDKTADMSVARTVQQYVYGQAQVLVPPLDQDAARLAPAHAAAMVQPPQPVAAMPTQASHQPLKDSPMSDQSTPEKLLLVRVQDDLHGARHDGNQLTLNYTRSGGSDRNTLHWSVSSIVNDTPYGAFNVGRDGEFKGRIVVIADPKDMPAPAGWNQVDAWWRLRGERDAEGRLHRRLPVGDATIVAPSGTQVPEGAKAVFYDGGIEARDAAVKQVFAERGVELHPGNFWGWTGHGQLHEDWQRETAARLWPGQEQHIHLGAHQGSLDHQLENATLAGYVQAMKEHGRLYDHASGAQEPYVDVMSRRADAAREDVHKLLTQVARPAERPLIEAHYQDQLQRIDRQLQEGRDLDQKLMLQTQPTPAAQDRQAPQTPPPLPQAAQTPPPLSPAREYELIADGREPRIYTDAQAAGAAFFAAKREDMPKVLMHEGDVSVHVALTTRDPREPSGHGHLLLEPPVEFKQGYDQAKQQMPDRAVPLKDIADVPLKSTPEPFHALKSATVTQQPSAPQSPRVQIGPDLAHWLNQNAQTDRDIADKRGLTAAIEANFAQGMTAKQVINAMGQQLEFLPQQQDRFNFVVGVRDTLGIPPQSTDAGKREFAAWKAEYDQRTGQATSQQPEKGTAVREQAPSAPAPAPAPAASAPAEAAAPPAAPAPQPQTPTAPEVTNVIELAMPRAPEPEKPAPAAGPATRNLSERERLMESLSSRFEIASVGTLLKPVDEYRIGGDKGPLRVAFTDHGKRLASQYEAPEVVRGMVDLAQAKGWHEINAQGTLEFRRNTWHEATLRGIHVQGYEPSQQDEARLKAAREQLAQQRQQPAQPAPQPKHANTIEAAQGPQPAKQAEQTPGKQPQNEVPATSGSTTTREQFLNMARSVMKDQGYPKDEIDKTIKVMGQKVDAMLARGEQLPQIKVYDKAAPSRAPVPTVVQQPTPQQSPNRGPAPEVAAHAP